MTVFLGFLSSISITPKCLSRESAYVLVYLFVCLHVCMFGEGDFALKALRNDMGFRHETLHGVKWGGGGCGG